MAILTGALFSAFSVATKDIKSDIRTVTVNQSTTAQNVTSIADAYQVEFAGLNSASMTIDGYVDPDADQSVAVLQANVGKVVDVSATVGSTALGMVTVAGKYLVASFNWTRDDGTMVGFSCELRNAQGAGPTVTRTAGKSV